ncbi:MAG: aminotransferase class V-fold PLP-dependent enzyme [Candidatus Latescibacteria bacterium]|nr:aminotransferase class V-fold PLP-dependent enzyme [Candidatus Latescibacterota bacterium]
MKALFQKGANDGVFENGSRRNFLKKTSFVSIAGLTGCARSTEQPDTLADSSIPTYESIGVRPFINLSDVTTIFGGSLMLSGVKIAMEEASRQFIHLDELMECVGARLAKLTGAEWGIIAGGCAACMTGATCACVAGTDPEKMAMLPDTTGMKDEVLVQRIHRDQYDRAIWMVGVKMIEVDTAEELEAGINNKTAMIEILGKGLDRKGSITLEDFVRIGKKHNIPIMVDASAEPFHLPNPYIRAGVDMVGYSGGKHMFGPQNSGILLGRKELVKAAFLNLAPHHAYGRPMKCAKEDIMGGLAAAELWAKRDHDAEFKEWERMLQYVADNINPITTVEAKIVHPTRRTNVYPRLVIDWDQTKVKITKEEVSKQLLEGEPKINCFPGYIISVTMQTGEEIPVARRFYEILSSAV